MAYSGSEWPLELDADSGSGEIFTNGADCDDGLRVNLRGSLDGFPLLGDHAAKFLDALGSQQEFHAGHHLVFAVAEFVKDAQNGFGGGKQFLFREEIGQDAPLRWAGCPAHHRPAP